MVVGSTRQQKAKLQDPLEVARGDQIGGDQIRAERPINPRRSERTRKQPERFRVAAAPPDNPGAEVRNRNLMIPSPKPTPESLRDKYARRGTRVSEAERDERAPPAGSPLKKSIGGQGTQGKSVSTRTAKAWGDEEDDEGDLPSESDEEDRTADDGGSDHGDDDSDERDHRGGDGGDGGRDPGDSDPSDDDPGDGDDGGGGGNSNPPPPKKPPSDVQEKIQCLKQCVKDTDAVAKGVNQFVRSHDPNKKVDGKWFDIVADVGGKIVQQEVVLSISKEKILRRYPKEYDSYIKGRGDLYWSLWQIVDELHFFLNEGILRALFDGTETGDERKAEALFTLTLCTIRNLLNQLRAEEPLPPEFEERHQRWVVNIEQFSKELQSEGKTKSPKNIAKEGGTDANGAPLETKPETMRRVISDYAKLLKDAVTPEEKERISCSQLDLTTRNTLSGVNLAQIEKLVAFRDIDRTLLLIVRTAVLSLERDKCDEDVKTVMDTLTNGSPDQTQEPKKYRDWLEWILSFSTLLTLANSTQGALNAIYSFPEIGSDLVATQNNFITGIRAIDHQYEKLKKHPKSRTDEGQRLMNQLQLNKEWEKDPNMSGLAVGRLALLNHEHLARVILDQMCVQWNLPGDKANEWIVRFKATVTSYGEISTSLDRFASFYRMVKPAVRRDYDSAAETGNHALWEKYTSGLIKDVIGVALWRTIEVERESAERNARNGQPKSSRSVLVNHITNSVQDWNLDGGATTVVEKDPEDSIMLANVCGVALAQASETSSLEWCEGDAEIAAYLLANVTADAVEIIDVSALAAVLEDKDKLGPDTLGLHNVNKESSKCFCCNGDHLLRDCEQFASKLQFLLKNIIGLRENIVQGLTEPKSEEEKLRRSIQISSAIITAVKRAINPKDETNPRTGFPNKGIKFGNKRSGPRKSGQYFQSR